MNNILVGKTLLNIKIAADKKAILFVCEDAEIIAKTDGDCCSDSWVEHIELPAMGFPAKVISVVNLELTNTESPDDYELIRFYGLKIDTDKGTIVLDYRNSSNGYYGGNLCWPGGYFYGDVYSQNISEEVWKDVLV